MGKKPGFWEITFERQLYMDLMEAQENQDLLATLAQMQMVQGQSMETAVKTARELMEAVVAYESVRRELSNDLQTVVDNLLQEIAERDNQVLNLHKLFFALTRQRGAHQVPAGELENQFWVYYQAHGQEKTVQELEACVREELGKLQISPNTLRYFAKQIQHCGDHLATADALGEGGFDLKCIAAMEIYLSSGEEIPVMEAAAIASTDLEIQAAADAVGEGIITRNTAKMLIKLAVIALVLVALVALVYAGIEVAGIDAQIIQIENKALGSTTNVLEQVLRKDVWVKEFIEKNGDKIQQLETVRQHARSAFFLSGATGGYTNRLAEFIGKQRVIAEPVDLKNATDPARQLCIMAAELEEQAAQEKVQPHAQPAQRVQVQERILEKTRV